MGKNKEPSLPSFKVSSGSAWSCFPLQHVSALLHCSHMSFLPGPLATKCYLRKSCQALLGDVNVPTAQPACLEEYLRSLT